MGKCISVFVFLFAASISGFAQLTVDDIKELLIIQGRTDMRTIEESAAAIYSSYRSDISCNTADLLPAIIFSAGGGTAEGFSQSRTAGYNNTEWLPEFMQEWYRVRTNDEAVFARLHTWPKIFREADYILSRKAFNRWNRFCGGRWYIAYPSHWIIKNISAWGIRNKMKNGNFF